MKKPPAKVPPITLEQVPSEWIELRRGLVRAGGRALRAGPAAFTIEIKSITPTEQLAACDPLRQNAWAPLMLPGGAVEFVDAAARDAVLRALQEGNA